jgi:DNA-directed RNA polymerase specialized sigma24 family protein
MGVFFQKSGFWLLARSCQWVSSVIGGTARGQADHALARVQLLFSDDYSLPPWRRDHRITPQATKPLSPEHREVIDLAYYHSKSVKEIAEIVGINEATVKTRMFYARKKLAELVASA